MVTNLSGVHGASDEEVQARAAMHPCQAGYYALPCPCGDSLAIMCEACDEWVFLRLNPGAKTCPHALEAMIKYG